MFQGEASVNIYLSVKLLADSYLHYLFYNLLALTLLNLAHQFFSYLSSQSLFLINYSELCTAATNYMDLIYCRAPGKKGVEQ